MEEGPPGLRVSVRLHIFASEQSLSRKLSKVQDHGEMVPSVLIV